MIQTLTEAHGYAPLELRVDGTHDISGNWSNQTTASEIWLVTESKATLSGEFTIYEGAPPIHIKGFNITARIDVEALAPLEFSDCKFRRAAASGRRLLEENEGVIPALLVVRRGHTTITNGDFEGLDRAIRVQGGTLVIVNSTFSQNIDSIYVTNGSTSIANTSFRASRGTALHVVGGNVVLKDQTLVEARPDQPAMNISNGNLVRYELPAPLGRWALIQNNEGIYHFESGEHLGDFPFTCSPGVVGDSIDLQDQSTPVCSSVCPPGSYCGPGTVSPASCPVGSWCAVSSSAPTACKPGTVGRNESLKSEEECEPCPPGSWCSAGDEIVCPRDTYQPLPSQSSAFECKACPAFSNSPNGSTSMSACKCDEDYYDAMDGPKDVECLRCPVGSACEMSGHTLARLPLLPGYWRTNNKSSDLRRCPDASSPNKSACANRNGVPCQPWTTGPYCRVCNVSDGFRYFDTGQSKCVECGDAVRTSLVALVGITLAVLLLLCWCGWRQPCKFLRSMAYQALLTIRAPLKQMLAFFQIVTRAESVFKIAMPESVAKLLNFFDSLNLSIDGILGLLGLELGCLQLGSFFNQLLFLLLSPCVLGLLVLACSMAVEVFTKRETASLQAGVIRSLPYLLYILFIAFPLASSRAFQAFDCEEFDDGTRFLRADYSLDCNDNAEYNQVFFLAWVAIALYPVCVPLLYLALLLSARKAILTEHPTDLSRSLTFLHQDYEPSMFWWEIVEISKKLFLVGFCVLIQPGSTLQLVIGFVFSLIVLLLTSIAGPFQRRGHDMFCLYCNFALVMFLFFGLVLKMGVLLEAFKGSDLLSDEVLGAYILDEAVVAVLGITLLVSVIVVSALAVYQVYQSTRAAARAAAAERENSIARGRLTHPPSHEWKLRQGNRYCMFLSHYKVEAGSDARYLSDLIKRKTGSAAYLDSNDLVDLRTLFNEGVHKSDLIVVLATKGVLTRPWCLLEMWEAALNEIPIVIFPVVGGEWTQGDACTLLSDLMGQMQSRNPWCMAEVMAHVGTQGVTDVREVEDVLLAHIGLVSSLERPGRPASMELDQRLCAHLKKDVADLASWLPAHNAVVEQRLSFVSWKPWGSDNQIIASVQTLVGECALALGRAPPEWTDSWESSVRTSVREELSNHLSQGLQGCLCWPGQTPSDAGGRLLIICASGECGGPARLIQRRMEDELQCEVVIGSDDVNTWRGEVDSATRGVVLLQTQSVLRNAVRLLQLFEAVRQRHPLVCVNVEGGGYDFAKVKPLLLSLPKELPQGEMATLRAALVAHGNGVGQLGTTISGAVPYVISVFLNPAANDVVMEAAIKDILDQLKRISELLESGAIAVAVLGRASILDLHRSSTLPDRLGSRTDLHSYSTWISW